MSETKKPKLQLQLLFTELDAKYQRKREIEQTIKETRDHDAEYNKLKAEQAEVQSRMKTRRLTVDAGLQSDFDELENLKKEISELDVDMGLVAAEKVRAGQPLVAKNKRGEEYEGEIRVRWKKTGDQEVLGEEKKRRK